MFIGILLFTENYPLIEELYNAKPMGMLKISDLFNKSDGLMVLFFIVMASGAFWLELHCLLGEHQAIRTQGS